MASARKAVAAGKCTKREKSSTKARHESKEFDDATGNHDEIEIDFQLDIDVELMELMREMTLTGSKTGHKPTPASDDDNLEPTPYIPRNVLYYGWFFAETVSNSLKEFANDFLNKCASDVPNFQDFISDTCQGKEIMDYFRKPSKKSKYHITAKFCGRDSDQEYENMAADQMGKVFDLNIVGLFITKSTVGYRVALHDKQMELFDNERKHERRKCVDSPSPDSDSSPRASPHHSKSGKVEVTKHASKATHARSKHKQNKNSALEDAVSSSSTDYPGLTFVEQTINLQPTSTRAHITIGCGPRVKAIQTGLDLLDLIDLEQQSASKSKSSDIFSTKFVTEDIFPSTGKSILRQFGRQHGDAYVIYFSHKIIAKAIFMAHA